MVEMIGTPKKIRGFDLTSKSFVQRDFATAGLVVQVDASTFVQLGRALQRFDAKRQDRIMVAALNKGMDRLYTRLKRKLVDWSGIRDRARAYRDVRKRPASADRWTSAVIVAGRYTRITSAYYAAKWRRVWPGVKHSGWRRAQIAEEAWLWPSKLGALRRVGRNRYPIVPLFGPSLPREVERHEREAQAIVNEVAEQLVLKEAQRLMQRALRTTK
jgi:hypothetical protein